MLCWRMRLVQCNTPLSLRYMHVWQLLCMQSMPRMLDHPLYMRFSRDSASTPLIPMS